MWLNPMLIYAVSVISVLSIFPSSSTKEQLKVIIARFCNRKTSSIMQSCVDLHRLSYLTLLCTACSMGGAVAVHVADRGMLPSLVGLCVIDVVEGMTAQTFCLSISGCFRR